ncbi:MAG: GWxTD domain-containing protein [Candidatus Aminicenantes bacterium]|nr:MAG: GWxTD domain-containing protein [Candidatus Aminicenantes bacterium]
MTRKNSLSAIFLLFFLVSFSFLNTVSGQESPQTKKKKAEPLSEWSKQWLEEVVPYIITSTEKEIFINLPTEVERGKFIINFWKKRDPLPETPENEFKQDYYKRVALANKFFGGSGIDGWRTDRGKIYILLGPPSEIQRDFSTSETSFTAFHGPKETWNYWGLSNPRLPYNLEFTFVDKFGTGSYVLERSINLMEGMSENFDINAMHYHFDYMEIMAEATRNPFEDMDKLKGIIRTQVSYDRIPIEYDLFCLKGEGTRAYVPLVIEIPYSALTQKEIEGKYYFSLTLVVNVSNKLGQIIYERSKDINFSHTSDEIEFVKDQTIQAQTAMSVEVDAHKIHLLVLDNFSGKVGTSHQEISVPKFSSEELSLSDIIFTSGRKSEEKEVTLSEEKTFAGITDTFRPDEELNVYLEAYNLTLNPETGSNSFRVEYSFLQDGKLLAKVPSPQAESTAEKDCRIQISFKLKNFKPGEYVLRAKVSDSNSGKTATRERHFTVTHLSP